MLIPTIKIYKNKRNELIVDFSWPIINVWQQVFRYLKNSRTVQIGTVGGLGVAIGIMVVMTVFRFQPGLSAGMTAGGSAKQDILKVILPHQHMVINSIHKERSASTQTTTYLQFLHASKQADLFEELVVGDEILAVKENNGIYYYKLREIRTIQNDELPAYLTSLKTPLVVYLPLDLISLRYRVYQFN